MYPDTKNIRDNIYQYCLRHCANGGPQVKGIDIGQYSSPVLSEPTLWMIVAISSTYHLIIGITYATNEFHYTLKDCSER